MTKPKQKPTAEQLYQKAAAKCAARECCRSDFHKKLVEAGMTAAEAESIIDRLEDEGFIDEARYARAFVHDRFEYAGWGRLKIRQALALKKINAANIDNALRQIDETLYRERLQAILKAKARSLPTAEPYETKMKLARFAASRGFEPGIIFDCLDIETIS